MGEKFVKRHALRSEVLIGQDGSMVDTDNANKILSLRERLHAYNPDRIYDLDKDGIFYKLLPGRTYVSNFENKENVAKMKEMPAKDCVTAYVCPSCDGKFKLPRDVIGTSNQWRCLRLGKHSVPQLFQRNVWSDSIIFSSWFHIVFVSEIQKKHSLPVVLLMKNVALTANTQVQNVKDHKSQVIIKLFPSNCTARHQPFDMGVISA